LVTNNASRVTPLQAVHTGGRQDERAQQEIDEGDLAAGYHRKSAARFVAEPRQQLQC
jgi:hypothetical protein